VNFTTFSAHHSVLVSQYVYSNLHSLETKETLNSFPFYAFNLFLYCISGVGDVRKFPPIADFEF
jgi:hypothetical protein